MKRILQLAILAVLIWAVRAMARGELTFGSRTFDAASLADAIAGRNAVRATVVGIAAIPASVTTAEAASGIGRLTVLGIFQSTPEIRAALSGRVAVTGTILDAD